MEAKKFTISREQEEFILKILMELHTWELSKGREHHYRMCLRNVIDGGMYNELSQYTLGIIREEYINRRRNKVNE